MKKVKGLVIERLGTDEQSFSDMFELLLELHKAGGYAKLDAEKAATNAYQMMAEGMTFLARVEGKPVGVLALTEMSFWYAQETFLQDGAFYVRPEFRGRNVGVRLMKAAKEEAKRRKKIAFVTVNNPDRRPKKTTMSLESQTAGYVPLGYTLKIG